MRTGCGQTWARATFATIPSAFSWTTFGIVMTTMTTVVVTMTNDQGYGGDSDHELTV